MRYPHIKTQDLIDLYQQGMSIWDIAGRVGMGGVGVWKRLKRAGVSFRPPSCQGRPWAIQKRGKEFLGADGRWWVRGIKSTKRRGSKRRAVIVMEQKLGHSISPGHHVHHDNEDITDDDPENLILLTASKHARLPRK